MCDAVETEIAKDEDSKVDISCFGLGVNETANAKSISDVETIPSYLVDYFKDDDKYIIFKLTRTGVDYKISVLQKFQ
jgi:hypothetical protein